MIGEDQFFEGLVRIGIAVGQPADAATLRVYYESLVSQVDEDEWLRFARAAVDTDRFKRFPKLAELRAALREFRGAPPLEAEAARVYERVLASGDYGPESGTTWSYRAVRDRCGDAAAEGFLVAGGGHAFVTTWDEARRRERFIAAYCTAVREDPSSALLPAGPQTKALPAPHAPSREEADKILAEIAGEARPNVRPKVGPCVVVASDERLELLRTQAEELTR